VSQGRPQDERNAKSARIREILDECARRRSAGEDVPDGDVIASHAELMPELQEALNQLAQPGRTGQDVTVTPTLGDDGSTEGRGTISPPLPGDTFAGYDIIRELSRGGQAAVYQTIQKSTKRKVAVKIPLEGVFASKSVRRRFEREIELVAQLKHPNIISIFDSGQTPDGRPFYVMDYVRGLPLHRYVRERKPTLEETLKLFATVCEAVQYAHQRAIIHRDLKPSNILVDSAGSPKILDFGLAKWIAEPVTTLVSVTRSMVGTLPYMSPEQTRGNPDEIDTRTDVYSLGVVLYEALTGKYPYPVAGEMGDVLRNIAEAPPTPPSRNWSIDSGVTKRASKRLRAGQCPIDGDVETIALRALAKDPARRYQSAGELARDVHHYLAGAPIDAKRDSSWYLLRMALRRYRGLAATAGLFLVLGIAFGIGMARMYVKTTGELVRQRERADAWAGLFGSETGGQARASTEPRIVDVRVDDTDRRTILVKYEGEDPWKAFKQLPPDVDDIDAVALADVDDSGRQLVVASTRLPTGSLIA
jgi:serine/threonine protein kinase